MYIWTKRQFVGEMERLVDVAQRADGEPGAVLIGHTHNERTWTPSPGQPLSPEGYRDLFETLEPRIFGEMGLFDDIVRRGQVDLARLDADEVLDRDPALTIVATRHAGVYARHQVGPISASRAAGEFRLNPLYTPIGDGDRVQLRLQFPSEDYADEYGACRAYLPEEVTVERAALDALPATVLLPGLKPLAEQRVILDLPKHYY
jgi:hypothetical protein